jgi:propanol-preferring alcohol dehydrogenase
MKAMVLNRYGAPLKLERRAERSPRAGEALLRVEAAALCGSDVHVAHGEYARPAGRFAGLAPPLVLGHQIAGSVVGVGPGCELAEGERCVVYCYLHCGACRRCLEGRQNVCQRVARRIGFEEEGGFAELVTVPQRNLFRAPAGMDAARASVLPDAVATSYHAVVRVARVAPGERVAVFGVGAVGLYAARAAALRSARVVAVDRVDDERLELARSFGAAQTLAVERDITPDAATVDAIAGALDGSADAVLDFVGGTSTLATAAAVARPGARVVAIGIIDGARIPLAPFAEKGIRLRTSLASTPSDLLEVIALAERGLVEPVVHDHLPLEDLNHGIERLARGEVVGRLVAVPNGGV